MTAERAPSILRSDEPDLVHSPRRCCETGNACTASLNRSGLREHPDDTNTCSDGKAALRMPDRWVSSARRGRACTEQRQYHWIQHRRPETIMNNAVAFDMKFQGSGYSCVNA